MSKFDSSSRQTALFALMACTLLTVLSYFQRLNPFVTLNETSSIMHDVIVTEYASGLWTFIINARRRDRDLAHLKEKLCRSNKRGLG